eukprot:GEZU01027802.1.p1 GENE.GEZU01027802.1~~GEZU01027802.1.p1  ORF type:complete len:106 (-),score=2.20 GEZU01027802.1:12-329(-)
MILLFQDSNENHMAPQTSAHYLEFQEVILVFVVAVVGEMLQNDVSKCLIVRLLVVHLSRDTSPELALDDHNHRLDVKLMQQGVVNIFGIFWSLDFVCDSVVVVCK